MRKTKHRIEVEPEPGFYETQSMIGIADNLRQEIEQLKAENLTLQIERDNAVKIKEAEKDILLKEIEQHCATKSENAKLQKELAKSQSAPMTQAELHDLLAPTIELLSNPMVFQFERERELSRLRDLVK